MESGAVPPGNQVISTPGANWHPSPNFGERRDQLEPGLIVLHYTAMQTAEEARERLCDPLHEVSAHYLICAEGQLWQLVDERARAWHAGAGSWQGLADINSRSIGIELANNGSVPFAAPQMERLEDLLGDLMTRWQISPMNVIGHSDMAPTRKVDPGPKFDWRRLAKANLSVWPDASRESEPDAARFDRQVKTFGYPDAAHAALLEAVRLRFRPWGRGELLRADMAVASGLEALRTA